MQEIRFQFSPPETAPGSRAGKRTDRPFLSVKPPDLPDLPVKLAAQRSALRMHDLISAGPHHDGRMVVVALNPFRQFLVVAALEFLLFDHFRRGGVFVVNHDADFIGDVRHLLRRRHVGGANDVAASLPEL
ncbi:hypothetical protein SDC9_147550 [bioreactor metagenome]|uniref:Uncharacterized protein n=1 Tax=bioreactor metagenome TaxID=1076179 RepID=A0A645EFZ2_9ZZZZ